MVSDSTNVLALECAAQRRQLLRADPKSKTAVHLAASHRLLRGQQYSVSHHLAHFSLFALCSAGQDLENLHFELPALVMHISFYLRALRAFLGSEVRFRVAVTDFARMDRRAWLNAQLLAPLQAEFSDAECVFDNERTSGKDYYVDLCFHIYASRPTGTTMELADGGVVNWTQKLLSNAKERCVISGIGSERVCALG